MRIIIETDEGKTQTLSTESGVGMKTLSREHETELETVDAGGPPDELLTLMQDDDQNGQSEQLTDELLPEEDEFQLAPSFDDTAIMLPPRGDGEPEMH